MKTYIISASIALAAFSLNQVTLACSNAFVSGKGIAAVARTMDLELNKGDALGLGAAGLANTSNINLPQKAPIHALKWQNKYPFLGQTAFKTYVVVDGINNQGLYAAYLDLPDITYYPTYNPKDKRPELGIFDVVNYVLGTAKNVDDALAQIKKAQIIGSAFKIDFDNKILFGGNPVHVVIRDVGGSSAVIEWTKSHGKPTMHVYHYIGGSGKVIEHIDGHGVHTYSKTQAAVLTNSPNYGWQLKNAAHYNKLFNGNTNRKWHRVYLNGSGMYGLPGSWTPVGRFVRGTQLIRNMPTPLTQEQASALANEVIDTMKVPAGGNPSTSLWKTVSDLKHHIYFFKSLMNSIPNLKTHTSAIKIPQIDTNWRSFHVDTLVSLKKPPTNWINAQVVQGKIANKQQAKVSYQLLHAPVPGDIKAKVQWQK